MNKVNRKSLSVALLMIVIFVFWTFIVKFVDVQSIGPEGSKVGLATLNGYFHNLIGVNMALYTITDWLSLVPLALVFGFATLGLIQLIKRKHIKNVDFDIIVLGFFYVVVILIYAFFEVYVVNYRPILIEGVLEASYPSSTTMLVMCIMPTAMMQLNRRIKNDLIKRLVSLAIIIFILFMVIARLVSGVHWLTDIVGGVILSTGLVMFYDSFCRLNKNQ